MTRAELLALAERVENAAGPEIIKEALFAICAMEREAYLAARRFDDWDQRAERWIGDLQRFAAGAYLDAAASLVPDGWAWQVNSHGTALCWPNTLDGPKRAVKGFSLHDDGTPANALAAAALRARVEEAGE